MKPMEIKAEKEVLRAEIAQCRDQLIAAIKTPKAIPQHIVDGSLNQVIEFKQRAEQIGKARILNAPPPKDYHAQAIAKNAPRTAAVRQLHQWH